MPTTTQPPAKPPRGNPNLNRSPRCNARTRAGAPCQAPAIHGKLRCRMHGGRSTGPRTPEGLARLTQARTSHGCFTAETRARNRYVITLRRRTLVTMAAIRAIDRLPADLAARLTNSLVPELLPPPRPPATLTRAQDQAAQQAEAASLAPWRQAVAATRQSPRATPPETASSNIPPKPHAPV